MRTLFDSGVPAAGKATKLSPILIRETKGNSWVDFLMVIMASGIARGCVRTTGTTTEWRKMAAILQVRVDRDMHPWFTVYFFDSGHSCYDQLKPVKTRYPLTSSRDFIASSKFTAYLVRMFFGSLPSTKCWFFDWIAGSCLVNLLKTEQGRVVQRPIKLSQG